MSQREKREEERFYAFYFFLLSFLLIILSLLALWKETVILRPWKEYQEGYYTLKRKRIEQELQKANNPKIEIKQIYIEELNKADRCISCHIGIDNPFQNNYPPPYTTHPAYFIYLENHPYRQFGCTICHQGQGRAITSVEKAHGRVGSWTEPMFEGEYIQGSCQHCHHDLNPLRGAEVLREGENILKKRGCLGCHRVDGYRDIDKIAPPLSRIGEKVSYTWLVKWLKDPPKTSIGARMPNFDLSEEDAHAIADLLYILTQRERSDEPANEGIDGDIFDKGKIVYRESRCSICHSANGSGGGHKEIHAPDLSSVGSKIKNNGLKKWLKAPKDYYIKIRKPGYRFTEEEINSLVEYMSGEYIDWDLEDAKMKHPLPIKGSSIKRGATLIKEYGCFGCHDIEGMEERIKKNALYLKIEIDELEEMVGNEITFIGDKPMEELDFGRVLDIPKTRINYLKKILKEPKAFRDDAKMPKYNLSEEEIDALVTLLLGFTKDGPLLRYRYGVPKKISNYQPRGEFAKILKDVKCLLCHKINGKGEGYAPDLSIEGGRVREEWLKDYLKRPDNIRPMIQQMPRFNLSMKEINIITDYIKTNLISDEIPNDLLKEKDISQTEIEKGKEIYLEKGCQVCHQIGEKGGAVGPNLTTVGLRLTPGYIYKYLKDPRISNKDTVEPNYGLTEEEIISLTRYLLSLQKIKRWRKQNGSYL